MLRGMTTVTYFADDLTAAVDWYRTLLGAEPYFERSVADTPAYVEFRIGDYQHEFGLLDSRFAPHDRPAEPAGTVLYWAVDDVRDAFERLLEHGAVVHQEPIERGPGFVTASVVDPFDNILGVMENQHYRDVLAAMEGVS